MLVELVEGFYVDPELVTVVKAAGDDKCVLYVTGQSALGGFVLPYDAEEVAQQVNEAFNEDDASDEDDDED